MKKILCFGDSNTFGFNPANAQRYAKNIRWTGVLQGLLGDEYKVIEAGCNNRTCSVDNPDGRIFTAYKILPELLSIPYDFVVIGLGINDLQSRFDTTIEKIKSGMENLIKMTNYSNVIILSPVKLDERVLKGTFKSYFNEVSILKSKELAKVFKELSDTYSCGFIDLNGLVELSEIDGLHHTEEQHSQIAKLVFDKITQLSA